MDTPRWKLWRTVASRLPVRMFVTGEGGFGGEREPGPRREPPPDTPPDHAVQTPTSAVQTLLYRHGGNDALALTLPLPDWAAIHRGPWARAGRPVAVAEDDTALQFTSVETRDSAMWFGPRFTDVGAIAGLLSLEADAIDTRFPIEVVSTGAPFLYVPLKNLKAMKSISGVAKAKALGEPEGGVATYRCTWSKKLAEADVAAATEALVAALVAAGAHVREVKGAGTSLEEVFIELTRGALPSEADEDAAEADT